MRYSGNIKTTEMLRVFTSFSGYDSQCLALRRLGIPFELVGWSEIDKYAIQAHDVLFPEAKGRNYGDISKIDWTKVQDFDLFTYSFPCGLAGTKVKTSNGYKNIEDVECGDFVLTHNNRYREVIRTMSRLCPEYYNINAIGCKLKLTAEHPLWVLRDGKEQWVKVKDLRKTDKLSYCIPQGDETLDISDEMLWLMGRYVADGFINKHLYNSVLFAICNKKESEFLSNIPYEIRQKLHKFQKSCIEYRVADKELQNICKEFGTGAKNKHIPEWLYSANRHQIECFLNGYFSGDGHVRYRSGAKVQMFTTVSKDLFLGIQLLLLKVHNKVCSLSIRHDNRKETFHDSYNGQLCFSKSPQQKMIGQKLFVSIKKIQKNESNVQVYNMEVTEDNSYTCDNVNTHNCTDISNAGQQKGLEKGSGTRSSLLWECEKAIRAKKPKYLLMENVSALVSQKFLPYYEEWRRLLVSLGYESWSKVLNATDYKVPQNRERIFMVSILGGGSFYFPEPFPLERRLKDILEEDVDERYYLSDKCVKGFMEHNRRHQEKGTGFLCRPKSGEDIGNAVRANGAICPTDNVIMEPVIAASQGRNPQNHSDRTAGCPTEQRLEIGGDISNTVTTVEKDCLVVMPICLNPKVDGKQPSLEHRVYDCGGISTAITTGFMPSILTPKRNEYGKSVRREYENGELNESRHKMTDCGMGGGQTPMVVMAAERLREMAAASRSEEVGITIDEDGNLRPHRLDRAKSGISEYQTERDTSTASTVIAARPNNVYGESTGFRIRKLTVREVFRLMDVDDSDIDKLTAAGISNTQLYKMAGNSIVVNVLYHIFRKMFVNKENENIQLTLF